MQGHSQLVGSREGVRCLVCDCWEDAAAAQMPVSRPVGVFYVAAEGRSAWGKLQQ